MEKRPQNRLKEHSIQVNNEGPELRHTESTWKQKQGFVYNINLEKLLLFP